MGVYELIFKRKKETPYKKIVTALYNVKNALQRIEVFIDRIDARRRKMFEITAELEMKGQHELAKRYAVEIARLDNIKARLVSLHLVLEKVYLSLEYALTMRNFTSVAKQVLLLTKEIKRLPESTIPDIGMALINLEESLRAIEDNGMIDVIEYNPPSNSEVDKILEEAKIIVTEKLMINPKGVDAKASS